MSSENSQIRRVSHTGLRTRQSTPPRTRFRRARRRPFIRSHRKSPLRFQSLQKPRHGCRDVANDLHGNEDCPRLFARSLGSYSQTLQAVVFSRCPDVEGSPLENRLRGSNVPSRLLGLAQIRAVEVSLWNCPGFAAAPFGTCSKSARTVASSRIGKGLERRSITVLSAPPNRRRRARPHRNPGPRVFVAPSKSGRPARLRGTLASNDYALPRLNLSDDQSGKVIDRAWELSDAGEHMPAQRVIRSAITRANERAAQAHTDEMRREAQADVAALVRERQKLMARKYAMGDSSSLFG